MVSSKIVGVGGILSVVAMLAAAATLSLGTDRAMGRGSVDYNNGRKGTFALAYDRAAGEYSLELTNFTTLSKDIEGDEVTGEGVVLQITNDRWQTLVVDDDGIETEYDGVPGAKVPGYKLATCERYATEAPIANGELQGMTFELPAMDGRFQKGFGRRLKAGAGQTVDLWGMTLTFDRFSTSGPSAPNGLGVFSVDNPQNLNANSPCDAHQGGLDNGNDRVLESTHHVDESHPHVRKLENFVDEEGLEVEHVEYDLEAIWEESAKYDDELAAKERELSGTVSAYGGGGGGGGVSAYGATGRTNADVEYNAGSTWARSSTRSPTRVQRKPQQYARLAAAGRDCKKNQATMRNKRERDNKCCKADGWSLGKYYQRNRNAFVVCFKNNQGEKVSSIAIRGSDNIPNWADNFHSTPVEYNLKYNTRHPSTTVFSVHEGFLKQWQNIKSEALAANTYIDNLEASKGITLDDRILIGSSAGSAQASIGARDGIQYTKLRTQQSPRVFARQAWGRYYPVPKPAYTPDDHVDYRHKLDPVSGSPNHYYDWGPGVGVQAFRHVSGRSWRVQGNPRRRTRVRRDIRKENFCKSGVGLANYPLIAPPQGFSNAQLILFLAPAAVYHNAANGITYADDLHDQGQDYTSARRSCSPNSASQWWGEGDAEGQVAVQA